MHDLIPVLDKPGRRWARMQSRCAMRMGSTGEFPKARIDELERTSSAITIPVAAKVAKRTFRASPNPVPPAARRMRNV
jgi:hypothetical protein